MHQPVPSPTAWPVFAPLWRTSKAGIRTKLGTLLAHGWDAPRTRIHAALRPRPSAQRPRLVSLVMIFFKPLKARPFMAAMLLCAASPVWALELQNQNFSDDEIFSAVVTRFKKPLQHRFNPADASERKPLLVLGSALKFGKKIQSQTFTHLTQEELVVQQQAVFVLVENASPDPERTALYVNYDIPSNASFGVLKVYPKDGVLVAESHDSFRSSSGARATYGKLYKGVACQDNTEMAWRWNYYARSSSGGRCPDKMFTEFTD
jgi:hypothetical protein